MYINYLIQIKVLFLIMLYQNLLMLILSFRLKKHFVLYIFIKNKIWHYLLDL